MEKNSKIYIAGHTGMVGSAVLRRLKKEGANNFVLATHQELNLLDRKSVEAFFEKHQPEYVIVCAARVGGIKANMEHQAEFLYENLSIQNNVIWSALHYGVKKLMFLGSSCIYPREASQPIKEEYLMSGRPEPTNEGYALAKIVGMKLCEYIYTEFDKKFISCMPTNIYGENDNFDAESSHVIGALMRRIHQAKIQHSNQVIIWGDGSARREFLYADDLADAIVFLLKNYNEKQFLNVGTGEDISIKELAGMIKKITGYDGQLVFDASKPSGMSRKLLDVSKLHQLGWRHTISLEDGLRRMYEWFLETPVSKN